MAYFLHVFASPCNIYTNPHTGISWHKYCNICKKCAKRQARILHFFIWGAFVGTDVANNTNPTQPKPANINKNKHIPTHPPLFFCRPPLPKFFSSFAQKLFAIISHTYNMLFAGLKKICLIILPTCVKLLCIKKIYICY